MDNDLGVRYGFIAGFMAMFFLTITYVVDPSLLIGNARWGMWGIVAVVMGLCCWRIRKENGNELGFREALRASFLVFLIANIFVTLFNYYMFAFYDPKLAELLRQLDIDYLNQIKDTMPSYEYEEKVRLTQSVSYAPSFGNVFFSYVVLAIYGFGISLIVALFMKREK